MARPGDTGHGPVVDHALVRAHAVAAFVALLISVTFGIIVAEQLVHPDMTAGVPWLSWGRLRYDHTQGIMLGWLGNAFLAFLYHAVPLLTGRRVTSARLGQWLFGLWNFAVVAPGWVLVLAGFSQPLEWAEFPLAIDAFVVLALVLAVVQFLPPFFAPRPRGSLRLELVHHRRTGLHAARVSDGQLRAGARAGRARAPRSAACGFTTRSACSSRRSRSPSSTS